MPNACRKKATSRTSRAETMPVRPKQENADCINRKTVNNEKYGKNFSKALATHHGWISRCAKFLSFFRRFACSDEHRLRPASVISAKQAPGENGRQTKGDAIANDCQNPWGGLAYALILSQKSQYKHGSWPRLTHVPRKANRIEFLYFALNYSLHTAGRSNRASRHRVPRIQSHQSKKLDSDMGR